MKVLTEVKHIRKVDNNDKYFIGIVYDPELKDFLEFGWIEKDWDESKFMQVMPKHYKFSHVRKCKDKEEYDFLKFT
jgi:hypothetical protein